VFSELPSFEVPAQVELARPKPPTQCPVPDRPPDVPSRSMLRVPLHFPHTRRATDSTNLTSPERHGGRRHSCPPDRPGSLPVEWFAKRRLPRVEARVRCPLFVSCISSLSPCVLAADGRRSVCDDLCRRVEIVRQTVLRGLRWYRIPCGIFCFSLTIVPSLLLGGQAQMPDIASGTGVHVKTRLATAFVLRTVTRCSSFNDGRDDLNGRVEREPFGAVRRLRVRCSAS
jgi:hypothetical protein